MTVRTKVELQTQIDTLLADNTAGDISAADVRSVLTDTKDTLALEADRAYFPILDADVGGTANAITLTTNRMLTALVGGMQFFFNSRLLNTGSVTIDVDGIGPMMLNRSLYRVTSGGDANTGSEPLEGGEITSNDPILVVYGARFNEFYLLPSRAGTAAYRNTGTDEHNVPVLGAGGDLPTGVIPNAANDTVSPGALLADSAAQKQAFRERLQTAVVNASALPSDDAVQITVGGVTYTFPDDVEDVTDTGIPALNADNYRQIFIDHDTPRVWIGHREVTAAVAAVGTFTAYTNTNYRGVISGTSPPANLQDGQFYYSTGNHGWWRGRNQHGVVFGGQVAFSTLFPNSDWLGEQPDDGTAAGLVDNFSDTHRYLYYNSGTGAVEELDNTTYIIATDRILHYTAEPISSPNIVGSITGITAGAGLTGGGDSGVVTLDIDPTEADFPVIGVDKGGTGAATAAAALAALGAAGLASPALTGTPTAPTAPTQTSTTQIASTAFVAAAIASAMLGGGADGVLSMVEYDDSSEEIVFTLSTGTVLRVPLMDLVAGFITEAQADDRVVAGVLATALAGNTDTWASAKLPAATDAEQGAVELATNDETTAGTDATRATSPAGVAAAIQAALQAAVTSNTETGISVTYNNDGTLDFVVGAAPAPTHTSYVGVSTDTTITAAEANAGTSGTGNALAIPTFTGANQHVFFARPTSAGAITAVYLYQSGSPNTNSQIGSWTAVADVLVIGGEDHNVIYSTAAFSPASSGFIVEVV